MEEWKRRKIAPHRCPVPGQEPIRSQTRVRSHEKVGDKSASRSSSVAITTPHLSSQSCAIGIALAKRDFESIHGRLKIFPGIEEGSNFSPYDVTGDQGAFIDRNP